MKKTLLDIYLEQMQTSPGITGPVKHAISKTAGGDVLNKNIALKLCYEKYCSNLMSDAQLADPVNQILHKKMLYKCQNQCYLNYLHQKKSELEEKMPLYTGVLLANEKQKLQLVNW